MKTKEAVEHFGGYRELCKFLDISAQAYYQWGETVPRAKAFELFVRTECQIPLREEDYK